MADLVYPPVLATAYTAFRLLGLQFRIEGSEHVPRRGGAVLACNHVSYLDFIFAGLAARPSQRLVRFMAKEAVFRHRVAGPLMRGMHHIAVDREAGAASYRAAVEALRRGEVVGVFPEATISRSFRLKGFKTGAARMATEAGVPVVPMVVWGGQRILTKGRPRDLTRGRTISITVGPALTAGDGEDAAALTGRLHAAMAELLDRTQREHPDTATPGADPWWLPRHLGGCAPTLDEAEELDRAEVAARRAARQGAGSGG